MRISAVTNKERQAFNNLLHRPQILKTVSRFSYIRHLCVSGSCDDVFYWWSWTGGRKWQFSTKHNRHICPLLRLMIHPQLQAETWPVAAIHESKLHTLTARWIHQHRGNKVDSADSWMSDLLCHHAVTMVTPCGPKAELSLSSVTHLLSPFSHQMLH